MNDSSGVHLTQMEIEVFRLQSELLKARSENMILKRTLQSFIDGDEQTQQTIKNLRKAAERLWQVVSQRMGE